MPRYRLDKAYLRKFTGLKDIFQISHVTGAEYSHMFWQWITVIGDTPDILPEPYHSKMISALKSYMDAYTFTYRKAEFSQGDLDLLEVKWDDALEQIKCAFKDPTHPEFAVSFRKPKWHMYSHLRLWIEMYGPPFYWTAEGFEEKHKPTKDTATHLNNKEDTGLQLLRRTQLTEFTEELAGFVMEAVGANVSPDQQAQSTKKHKKVNREEIRLSPVRRTLSIPLDTLMEAQLKHHKTTLKHFRELLAFYVSDLHHKLEDQVPGDVRRKGPSAAHEWRVQNSVHKVRNSSLRIHTKLALPYADNAKIIATHNWYKSGPVYGDVEIHYKEDEKWYATIGMLFSYEYKHQNELGKEEKRVLNLMLIRSWYEVKENDKANDITPMFPTQLKRGNRYSVDILDIIKVQRVVHIVPSFHSNKNIDSRYYYLVPIPLP